MRISNGQILLLKSTITDIIEGASVYLFGSRVDDDKKGGDIDVLIVAERKLERGELTRIRRIFCEHYGQQKIDLVSFTYEDRDPFKQLALYDAIEL